MQEFLLPVGAGGSITEFTAGATLGTFGAAQTFASGLNNPTGLAFDARGNVAHRVNSGGGVLSSDLYDAYGVGLARAGSTVNSFLFQGQQYDAASGTY